MTDAEKSAQVTTRVEKKAARRAAFIQEVAEAVLATIADSVPTERMPIVNISGMWLHSIAKKRREELTGAALEVSPSVPAQL